jgi:hypothetical protein
MSDDDNEALKRRGDNVGQSGRWRREDGKSDGDKRYGNEEGEHDSEHPRPDVEPGDTDEPRPTE